MHYLYKITNILNGKIYIGQSNNTRRWSQHKYFAKYPEKTGQYIHRAMAKHGVENFTFEIIATCKTQQDADDTEDILIIQYNSRDKNYGYNLTVGGNHGGHSEETKQKLRKAFLHQIATKGHPAQGTKRTPEQRERLSKAQQNRNNNYTPEMRQKMSESHIGKEIPDEQRKKMVAGIKANWEKRIAELVASGELKCNAPNCDINGIAHKYLIINDVRYCTKHGQRLKNTGFLELQPHSSHNKGKKTPEEVLQKLRGRTPHNKIVFTEEEIAKIMCDPRSNKKIAKDFGITEKVIKRVKAENGIK